MQPQGEPPPSLGEAPGKWGVVKSAGLTCRLGVGAAPVSTSLNNCWQNQACPEPVTAPLSHQIIRAPLSHQITRALLSHPEISVCPPSLLSDLTDTSNGVEGDHPLPSSHRPSAAMANALTTTAHAPTLSTGKVFLFQPWLVPVAGWWVHTTCGAHAKGGSTSSMLASLSPLTGVGSLLVPPVHSSHCRRRACRARHSCPCAPLCAL